MPPPGVKHKSVSVLDLGASIGLQPTHTETVLNEPEPQQPKKLNAEILGASIGLKKKEDGEDTTIGSPDALPISSPSNLEAPLPSQKETIDFSFKPNERIIAPITPELKAAQELQQSNQRISDKKNTIVSAVAEYNSKYAPQVFDNTVEGLSRKEVVDVNDVLNDPEKASRFLQEYETATGKKAQRLATAIPIGTNTPEQIKNTAQEYSKIINDNSPQVIKQHIAQKIIEGEGTKEEKINKIYQFTNPQGYKETIKAYVPEVPNPLNPVQALGAVKDAIFGTEEKDQLLNSGKGQATLAYNNGLNELANEKITQGITEQNPELVKQGQDYLKDVKDNWEIFKQYPQLGKQMIASEVAQELARDSGQLEGTESEGRKSMREKIFGATPLDIMSTSTMKSYLSDPKTKEFAEMVIKDPSSVSDASYTGGFLNAAVKPVKDLLFSAGDLTGFRQTADVIASKRKDELFPEQTPGLKPYVSHIRGAVNTTGNLLGMMAISVATEGAAIGAGAEAATAQKLGAYTSFGIPSFDQNLKDSYNFIDNDGVRTLYATMGAMINAEGGRLLDLGKVSRIPELQNSLTEIANKVSDKTVSKELVNELLGKAENPYVNAAMKYGVNVTKGAATMSYFTFTNGVNKMLFGDEQTTPENLLNQTGTAFLDGVLGMSVLGAFGAAADLRKEKNTSYKQNIYSLSQNFDAAIDVYKTALNKGEITPVEYNQKVQIVNTAKTANELLKQAELDNNTSLNGEQKAVYVANRTAEGVIKKQLEKENLPEAQKEKYETQLNRLQQQREDVFNGLKFSPTLEPLYDLFNAEKEYNQALQDIKTDDISEQEFLQKKDAYQNLQYKYFTENKFGTQKGENLQDVKVGRESVEAEQDKNILNTFEKVKKSIPEEDLDAVHKTIKKVNNAESINENELGKTQDALYKAWDKAPEARHLIEPLIRKLQDYEFETKTETRTVTEEKPVEIIRPISEFNPVSKALDQWEGNRATIIGEHGKSVEGVLKTEGGKYALFNENGEKIASIGEKAITDRDVSLPSKEEVPTPIHVDNEGNVKSITLQLNKVNMEHGGVDAGNKITIHFRDHEKALNYAIQLRAEQIGEIPQSKFDTVYEKVEREIKTEVPKVKKQQKIITEPKEQPVSTVSSEVENKHIAVGERYFKDGPEKDENDIETNRAVIQGLPIKDIKNNKGGKLPDGYSISLSFLKEGQKINEGAGQEVYKKALDEYGTLYSVEPVSTYANRVHEKLVSKGEATIEDVILSDGTKARKITKAAPVFTVSSEVGKDIVTPEGFTNRVFEKNTQLGTAPKDAHISEEGYNYRVLSQKEIDAIKESGGVFSREGKQKGGNSNTKYWTKGNNENWYGDKESQETIRVKQDNFKENEVVKAENIEVYNKETKQFEPLIKPENKPQNEAAKENIQSNIKTDQHESKNDKSKDNGNNAESKDASQADAKGGNQNRNEKEDVLEPPPPPQGKEKAPVSEGDKFKDKGILNRLFNAENVPEHAKEGFKEQGLKYEPQTQDEAAKVAKAMVDEYGIEDAVTLAETGKFKGGVNSGIFAESLNRLYEQEQKSSTPAEKLEAAKKFAEVSIRFDELSRQKGRDISQVAHFYKKSPLGIKIVEETRRREEFNDFAKKKNQSWKEFFDEMVKEPEFEKIFKENVRDELKKERAEARKSRKEKVDAVFDKAKDQFKGGAAYSTIIPPKLITAAIDGMQKAYHAGEKVVELVQNAIDYISSELGTSWDKEKFRKEWEEKLSKGEKESKKTPAELSEEKRQKLLERFRNKLKGLSEKEKDEVIRKSFKKLVENGALEYDDFKKIIADTLGYGELTPEQSKKITDLVTEINQVEDLGVKLREGERNDAALKKYLEAKQKAEKSATELGKLVFNRPDIIKRLLSVMQLNTLGIPSLINNPIFNVFNQATVRLPRSIIMTAMDYAMYGAGKLVGKDWKPQNDVVQAQRQFYNKLGQGTKQSVDQLFNGLTNKDYFQKEVYASQIHPVTSMRELWNYGRTSKFGNTVAKALGGKEKNRTERITTPQWWDKAIQGTVGVPAEMVARVLNIGDKPQRYASEGAQATTFARNLGLKGIDYKLFMEFPKEEAYRKFKRDGLSDEAAMKKAEEIKDRIIKEGEESTFQQDNLLNDALTAAFKPFGKPGEIVKTLNMPFVKIPINAFWSVYNLANWPVAMLQSAIYAGKAIKTKSPIDIQQSKKWFAHAVTGMAWMAATAAMAKSGIINAPNPDDATKKEREGEQFYEQQNSVNMSKLLAWMSGKDPSKVRGGLNVDLKWLGNMGVLMGYQAQKLEDMTPEQRKNEADFMEDMISNLSVSAVDFMDKGVFSNTGALFTAISKGGSFMDNYLINLINMAGNIVQPAAYAQISRAQLPYYSKQKSDTFLHTLENSILTRSTTLRNLTGKYPPSKIGIWGDKLEKKDNTIMRLFGISRSNDDNFAQPIYKDYKKSGNTKFFPSSVKPEIRGGDETVKLNPEQAAQLETLVGQNRKSLVAPYVNDMATFEGSKKHYSELSEEEKINNLNILYDLGFETGKKQFLALHPEIQKQVTPSEQEVKTKNQKENQNKELRNANKVEKSTFQW